MSGICTQCGEEAPKLREGMCVWCIPAELRPVPPRRDPSYEPDVMEGQHRYYDAIVLEGIRKGGRP